MPVRAKFKCNSITRRQHWASNENNREIHDAEFIAVTSGSEENKKFFASTPGGKINVQTVEPNLFELGKEYYVDFTAAE